VHPPDPSERPIAKAIHICLDMQNLIGPEGPWAARWAELVLPAVVSLIEHAPEQTFFTRFVPPREVPARGAWCDFYSKWNNLPGGHLPPEAFDLLAPLKLFVPPAMVFDKARFSAFTAPGLADGLQAADADTLILSGAESDMCVLATALGGIDLGYRIVIATDAICSASDPCHEAVQRLYSERYSAQVRALPVVAIRELWQPSAA
jgi:nicotinamidase-related amidase